MELITNDIEVKEGQILPMKLTNFEDLKKEIVAKMQEYRNMVVTEEKLKEAKTYRANLNKFEKAIANQRLLKVKEAEEQVGITKYVEECKYLEQYVKDASSDLDKQIKAFEKIEDDKKLKEITEFFIKNVGEFEGLIDFDKIYNPKWLNKTYKMEGIQAEIRHVFTKTKTDFDVISSQFADENIQKQVKRYYLNQISDASVLTLAILEGNKIVENNKKLEELQQVYTKSSQNITESEEKVTESEENITNSSQNQKLYTIAFLAEDMTIEQMQILKKCLKENNIKYGPVPKTEISKKSLTLDYTEENDEYVGVRYQAVSNDEEKIYFSVNNLDECPEDAIIGRDLFTADDYVSTLNKGIELAKKGYTEIEINEIESEEE